MLPPSFPFLPPDAVGFFHSSIVVEHEDIAPLILLVVYQREDIYIPELRKRRFAQDPLSIGLPGDIASLLFQSGKHPEGLVRGELKRAVSVGLEADGELCLCNLIDDLDVFFL